MAEATRLTVCACTHRRPEGLRALLHGLAAQRFAVLARPRFDVLIVDNEGSEEAHASCEQIRQAAGRIFAGAPEKARLGAMPVK